MLKFRSYISEHIINIGFHPSQEHQRETHRAEIHGILKRSYKHIGYGGQPIGSDAEDEAIHHDITHSRIKAVRKGGKITSVALYKDLHGRKQIAGGTDGTRYGKLDWAKQAHDDYVNPKTAKQRNAWIEASGGPQKIVQNMGVKQIPVKKVKKLMPDKHIEAAPDKGPNAYRRQIGTGSHTKTAFGHPK